MKLTHNFYLAEFEHSNTAKRHSPPIDNRIPATLMPNVRKLASVMQNIRDYLGHPVIISSGYRCPQLNRAVRGASNSDHVYAAAADFIVPGFGDPYRVCQALERKMHELGIRQMILEYGHWIHVGVIPVAEINRVLTIDERGTLVGLQQPLQAA
jgi:zinc D-Ala-D-Ala carboxypeptidase